MGKKRLVVLTGAGMSAESGISTFRDSDGLWEQYPVQKVASIEGFRENPQLVLDFYTARRRDFVGCEPNGRIARGLGDDHHNPKYRRFTRASR